MLSKPRRGSAGSKSRWLLTGVMLVLVTCAAAGCGSGGGSKTPRRPSYPPKSLASFQAFAATGDAARVDQVGTSSTGSRSCPETTIYVTVSQTLTGHALRADLSAFFVHSGLIKNQCPATVDAYYSRNQYQADKDTGYTAGSVALTGAAPQLNLMVSTGQVTSGTYHVTAQFSFSF